MKLLAYGSLRKFHPNHRSLGVSEATEYLGEVRIPETSIYQLRAWYPGVIKDKDGKGVVCDLFEIKDPAIIRRLDAYEGYRMGDERSSLFVRKNVTLPDGSGEAYMYFYNNENPDGQIIENGDWHDFYTRQQKVPREG